MSRTECTHAYHSSLLPPPSGAVLAFGAVTPTAVASGMLTSYSSKGCARQAPLPISSLRPQKPQSEHMYSQPHRLHCPPAPGHVPSEHALLPQYLNARARDLNPHRLRHNDDLLQAVQVHQRTCPCLLNLKLLGNPWSVQALYQQKPMTTRKAGNDSHEGW